MELTMIRAGRIVNTHGVRGEVKVLPEGVEPELLLDCPALYVDGAPMAPAARRVHKGCLLVKLKGIEDMDAALALKGKAVSIRRADVDEELTGLTARDAATGETVGTVEEVLHYPAHKLCAVRGGRDEYLVPFVPAFIAGVDLVGGTIDIHMMEGLGSHED